MLAVPACTIVRVDCGDADATVLDAGALYEIETGSLFNVTALARLNLGTLAVSHRVIADGCNRLDATQGSQNFMVVRGGLLR